MNFDPEIEERNAELHRTLVEKFVHSNQPEVAAAMLDGGVDVEYAHRQEQTYFVEGQLQPGIHLWQPAKSYKKFFVRR